MGMDTGAVAGWGDDVFWNEAIRQGMDEGSKAKELLESFL